MKLHAGAKMICKIQHQYNSDNTCNNNNSRGKRKIMGKYPGAGLRCWSMQSWTRTFPSSARPWWTFPPSNRAEWTRNLPSFVLRSCRTRFWEPPPRTCRSLRPWHGACWRRSPCKHLDRKPFLKCPGPRPGWRRRGCARRAAPAGSERRERTRTKTPKPLKKNYVLKKNHSVKKKNLGRF